MPWTVSRRTERLPQGNKGKRGFTVHWSAHPQGEQNEAGKCSHGINWLQKGLWYGPTILNSRLSENVQDIWQSHKIHLRSHKKLESGINSRKKRGENPEGNLPRRCTFVITVWNSNAYLESTLGATNSLNYKKRWLILGTWMTLSCLQKIKKTWRH